MEITLNSNTPFIRRYDDLNKTTYGKFFDYLEEVGMPVVLIGPSEADLLHASLEPFRARFSGSFKNLSDVGVYKCMEPFKMSSIPGVFEKLLGIFREKAKEGFLLADYGRDIFYTISVTETSIEINQKK